MLCIYIVRLYWYNWGLYNGSNHYKVMFHLHILHIVADLKYIPNRTGYTSHIDCFVKCTLYYRLCNDLGYRILSSLFLLLRIVFFHLGLSDYNLSYIQHIILYSS